MPHETTCKRFAGEFLSLIAPGVLNLKWSEGGYCNTYHVGGGITKVAGKYSAARGSSTPIKGAALACEMSCGISGGAGGGGGTPRHSRLLLGSGPRMGHPVVLCPHRDTAQLSSDGDARN